jgi:hypothetical protein
LNNRFLRIDELVLSDHWHLNPNDECYYIGEYTARGGHACSETNQLVHNFKKSIDRRGRAEWAYKERAIGTIAAMIRANVRDDAAVTFVPIPPSKTRADPLYDDRMTRVLRMACAGRPADVRELIVQINTVEATHLADERPSIDEVRDNYRIDETLLAPEPGLIFLVDDVITTGCHFKAAKQLLSAALPNTQIVGIFVARRVPKSDLMHCLSEA